MMKKIKSIFFIRLLFSTISQKHKLNMIKYNKKLQKLVDINLMNYKLFTGKYILYKENGKVEEHNSFHCVHVDGEHYKKPPWFIDMDERL